MGGGGGGGGVIHVCELSLMLVFVFAQRVVLSVHSFLPLIQTNIANFQSEGHSLKTEDALFKILLCFTSSAEHGKA